MAEKKIHNRGWVKNAAIIFLAIMLVLTFFSNTILNRSLPEVAGANVQSGSISAKIRGSGTVQATSVYEVLLQQTRKVATVLVKVGDTVAVGDELFTLADSESEELRAAKETLDGLNTQYRIDLVNASAAYTEDKRAITNAQNTLNTAIAKRNSYANSSSAAVQQLQNDITALKENIAEYKSKEAATGFSDVDEAKLKTQQRAIEDAKLALDSTDSSDPEYAGLRNTYNRAREDYDDMRDANKQYEKRVEAEAELASKEAQLATTQTGFDNWSTADEAVQAAQKTLDDLVYALEQKQNVEGAVTNINLEASKKKIALQQELVNELQSEAIGSTITAPMAGVVTAVNITAGNDSVVDTPLAIIESPDQGYYLTFSVTAEQAKRLTVGAAADVSTYYWSSEIKATLSAIRPDKEDPNKKRLLYFTLSGENIYAGDNLSLSVGEKSAEYATIVPNSAVRNDSNGDFVLILESRNTPLGNRYIARRIDVQVLAKDDNSSAVSGGIAAYQDFVITTSSKPITPGMQVRMAEN